MLAGALVAVVLAASAAGPATAQAPLPQAGDLDVGFQEQVGFGPSLPGLSNAPRVARRGSWCPVDVLLQRGGPISMTGTLTVRAPQDAPFEGTLSLEVWRASGDDGPLRVLDSTPVELAARSARRVQLAFVAGDGDGVRLVLRDDAGAPRLVRTVRYGEDEGELALLDRYAPFYATLVTSPETPRLVWPSGLARAPGRGDVASAVQVGGTDRWSPQARAVLIGPELPDLRALAGLDAVLVPSLAALDPAAGDALARYAADGGRLLLAATPPAGSPASGLLAAALPVEPLGFGARAGALAAIDSSCAAPTDEAQVLLGRARPGARVLLSAGEDAPLLSTRRHVRGHVAVLGVPFDSPALADDAGRTRLFSQALALPRPAEVEVGADLTSFMAGLDTLDVVVGSPLARVAAQAATVHWIPGLVLAFALFVGPIDYLVWRRVRRPRVTWTLLVVWSIGFAALASVFGRVAGAEPLRLHGVAVVDEPGPDDGAAPASVEALLCLASTHLALHELELPAGTRLTPAGGSEYFEYTSPDVALAIAGHRARVYVGVATPAALRVSGLVALPRTLVVERWVEGALEGGVRTEGVRVSNAGARALRVFALRRGHVVAGGEWLAPGQAATLRLQRRPGGGDAQAGDLVALQGPLTGFVPPFATVGWMSFVSSERPLEDLLLRATLQRFALRATAHSDEDPYLYAGDAGRADATPELERGATIVLGLAEGEVPIPTLVRRGEPFPVLGPTVYRVVLEDVP